MSIYVYHRKSFNPDLCRCVHSSFKILLVVVKLATLSWDRCLYSCILQISTKSREQKWGVWRNGLPYENFLAALSAGTEITTGRAFLKQMSVLLTLRMNDYILTFSIIRDREQIKILKPPPLMPLLNLSFPQSYSILNCFLKTEMFRQQKC